MKLLLAAALASTAIATSALAQEALGGDGQIGNARPLTGPSMALSLEAAQTAIASCKAKGYNVGVTIVDAGGGLRLVLGSDGALAADSNGSRRTALLSAAMRRSGSEIIEAAKADKALAAKIVANKDWMARDGAVLLKNGDTLFGVIAVEGHRNGPHTHEANLDLTCAQAGADRIKARLK